jgi:hypothetical protein
LTAPEATDGVADPEAVDGDELDPEPPDVVLDADVEVPTALETPALLPPLAAASFVSVARLYSEPNACCAGEPPTEARSAAVLTDAFGARNFSGLLLGP